MWEKLCRVLVWIFLPIRRLRYILRLNTNTHAANIYQYTSNAIAINSTTKKKLTKFFSVFHRQFSYSTETHTLQHQHTKHDSEEANNMCNVYVWNTTNTSNHYFQKDFFISRLKENYQTNSTNKYSRKGNVNRRIQTNSNFHLHTKIRKQFRVLCQTDEAIGGGWRGRPRERDYHIETVVESVGAHCKERRMIVACLDISMFDYATSRMHVAHIHFCYKFAYVKSNARTLLHTTHIHVLFSIILIEKNIRYANVRCEQSEKWNTTGTRGANQIKQKCVCVKEGETMTEIQVYHS